MRSMVIGKPVLCENHLNRTRSPNNRKGCPAAIKSTINLCQCCRKGSSQHKASSNCREGQLLESSRQGVSFDLPRPGTFLAQGTKLAMTGFLLDKLQILVKRRLVDSCGAQYMYIRHVSGGCTDTKTAIENIEQASMSDLDLIRHLVHACIREGIDRYSRLDPGSCSAMTVKELTHVAKVTNCAKMDKSKIIARILNAFCSGIDRIV